MTDKILTTPTACGCSSPGSLNMSCSSAGQCACNSSFTGSTCNLCTSGHYGSTCTRTSLFFRHFTFFSEHFISLLLPSLKLVVAGQVTLETRRVMFREHVLATQTLLMRSARPVLVGSTSLPPSAFVSIFLISSFLSQN